MEYLINTLICLACGFGITSMVTGLLWFALWENPFRAISIGLFIRVSIAMSILAAVSLFLGRAL